MAEAKRGERVKLIRCTDQYTDIQPGTLGTVELVDSIGTVHVKWDSGHRLGLIPGEDRWEVVPEKHWTEARTQDEANGPGFAGEPKYPDVEVQLTGIDGNAGAIMGAVTDALKDYFRERGESPSEAVKQFRAEAMSGDYDHLLRTAMRWVEVS